jgi:hypothetical protein
MKKTLMALFALALCASVASAGVGINWGTGFGVFDHTETDLVGGSAALLDSYSAIWQLIYAGADGIANPADYEQVGGPNGNYVTGDDVVWAQREITQGGGTAADGTSWDNWMTRQDGSEIPVYQDLGWTTAGSVYQRIFEGTPGPNTWWGDSSLFTFSTTFAEGSLPDEFYIDDPQGNFGWKPYNQFPPPIPEPATLSLLGLGALALIRRKRS